MQNKGNFYQTTALVTFFSVLERALGFLYRIVLARLLGAEGLGVLQIALSHFAFFRTLGGGGLPVTSSRLVAKERAEKGENSGKILSVSSILSLAITLPITVIFCFLDVTSSTLKILFIGLSFTCLYAVVKGFFWGNNHFFIPALLELGEEIIFVVAGVSLLRLFGNSYTAISGANLAAIACVIACVLSCVAACLCLLVFPKKERKLGVSAPLFKEIASSALPITAMRAGSTLISSAVAILFPAMLVYSGMTSSEATAAFGVVSGMALPLLSMPMTLVGSFALVLMPKLAEEYYQNQQKTLQKNIERGLTCALFVACLLLPFFSVFGENIGLLTYGNLLAGEMLKNCAPLLVPMSFCMISNTALNSMGLEKKTLIFYLIGAAAMVLCVLFLPAVIGVYAYSAGLFAQYAISGALNAVTLFKGRKPSKFFLRKTCLSLLFVLPVLFLGQGLLSLFSKCLGAWWSMGLTALCMMLASALLYLAFELFSTPFLRKIFAKR